MDKRAIQMFGAREKLQDSLQTITQADLKRIEEFLFDKLYSENSYYATPSVNLKNAKPGKRRSASDTKKMIARSAVLRSFYERKAKSLPTLENQSEWTGVPVELFNPSKYSFGYAIYTQGLVEKNYATGAVSISNGASAELNPFLKALDLTKSGIVPVIQGKVLDLCIVYRLTDSQPDTYTFIGVKADASKFKAAMQSLQVKGSGMTFVLANIYHNLINDRPVPTFFQKKLTFTEAIKPGAYMLPSGRLVYVPNMAHREQEDKAKEIRNVLSGDIEANKGKMLSLPSNSILFPDASANSIICTDDEGSLCSYSMSGLSKPNDKYKVHLLNKKFYAFFMDMSAGNLSQYARLANSTDIRDKVEAIESRIAGGLLSDAVKDYAFADLIVDAISYVEGRYGQIKLANWMTLRGMLEVVKKLSTESEKVLAANSKKREKFSSRTPDDAPALPNMRKDAVLFPHQAQALAQLDVAVDTAILDIGTGGGKAGIIIEDCLNLMNKGSVTRPLIVMPNSLISQFISEVAFFTGNQANCFALTSSVESKHDLDVLAARVRNMPNNTIFVTSFSWLSKGGGVDDYDFDGNVIKNYDSTLWLQENLRPDYVAVDESQNIKNMGSEAFKAVQAIGRGVAYKRIATGTLISNKPEDIVGQLMFLDPLIVGNTKEFAKRYYVDGDIKKGPKPTMAEDLRAHLRASSAYIMYREKDWAPLLPKKVYSFSVVEQSAEQAKVYKALVSEVMDEIQKDPKLAKAWQALIDGGEDMDTIPSQLLGKLARLEMFLTAPDSSKLLQYADDNIVSPKVAAIDKLIEKSMKMPGPNNKVIVAVHYKVAARHLMKHSKYASVSAYYDASQKDLIPKFQDPKSNIKVIFAVGQSLREGLNLQIANRVIVADIDWTPGALKQLEARVFRPHVRIKDGKVENLNKGKTVYLDTVICNDSADCAKYGFQSYKKILNSIIMEGCPVDVPKRVPFSEDALSARFTDPIIDGDRLKDKIDQFNDWNQEEIDASLAKGDLKFRAVKHAKSTLSTELAPVPWIKGMVLPAMDDEEPLLTYLDTLGAETEDDEDDDDDDDNTSTNDLTVYEGDLMGVRVRVEQGEGRIYSVRKGSILVRLDSGENVSAKPAVILHKKGSIGKGLTKREIRKGVSKAEERAAKLREKQRLKDNLALVKKTFGSMRPERPKKVSAPAAPREAVAPNKKDLGSKDPKVIKAYFKANGVKYTRQESNKGEFRCTLRFDGRELSVKTKFFKDLTLADWQEYVEKLLAGESGVFSPKALEPKAGKKPALSPSSSKLPNKGAKKTPKVKEDDDIASYLDDDDDDDDDIPATPKKTPAGKKTPVVKTSVKPAVKEPSKESTSELDDYLDDDFDFFTSDDDALAKSLAESRKPRMKQPVKKEAPVNVSVKAPSTKAAKKKAEEAVGMPLKVASYNNIPSLVAIIPEAEGEALEDLGFNWSGKYWAFKVDNLPRAQKTLESLVSNFTIPRDCKANITQVLSEFKRGIFKTAFPEEGLKAFQRRNAKKVKPGTLRVYPLVVGAELFLVVDIATHPGITLTTYRFKRQPGYYIFSAPTLASLRSKFRATVKNVDVANIETVKEESWAHLKVRVG